jgi:hypothetical protein
VSDLQPYDEWVEEFCGPRADDATIQALLEEARASGSSELRRVIKELQMWRWLAPQLLDRVVPAGARADESDQFLKLARFLVRGERAG